ncbi:uncharacterized protein LOC143147021 [Ptiloglossa arizonensis]|uniref:uncharacterized protein LOC143147021 n=1 Tax=Ptiloglossa arizonensis TaxID=3350558 RepID=UPI003FA0CE31
MSGSSRKPKIYRLFAIKDFKSLIHISIVVTRILGYLPYKIQSSKYVFSRIQFVWSTFVVFLHAILMFLSIYQINFSDEKIEFMSTTMHCNIILGLGLMNICSSYISSPTKIQVLQRVSDLSRKLPLGMFRSTIKWALINDLLKFCPLITCLPNIFKGKVVSNCILWYTFFLTVLLNLLYQNVVRVLYARFWKINESLVNVRETLMNDEPHLLRRVYHTQNNPVLLTELRTLKRHHLEISDVVQLLNDKFSNEVIGMIALTLVDITFNLYFYIATYTDKGGVEMWLSFQLACGFLYSWNLVSMVWACECVTDQAKDIGSNIHRIVVITTDEQIIAEVRVNTNFTLWMCIVSNDSSTVNAKGEYYQWIVEGIPLKISRNTTLFGLFLIARDRMFFNDDLHNVKSVNPLIVLSMEHLDCISACNARLASQLRSFFLRLVRSVRWTVQTCLDFGSRLEKIDSGNKIATVSPFVGSAMNLRFFNLRCAKRGSSLTQRDPFIVQLHRWNNFSYKLKRLELFSVQVLQQDNTFSAKGLAIDATLLTKVAGTITTYLLILIQFLLVKSC